MSLPPLIRTQLVLDWGPVLGPHSTLLISLKAVISKYSHIGGLRLQHVNLWGSWGGGHSSVHTRRVKE